MLNELPKTGPGGTFTANEGPPYVAGNEATLSCDPGYITPLENVSKVLLKNGSLVWEPAEINCLSNLKELPKTGPGGTFTANEGPPYGENTIVRLICGPGYSYPNFTNPVAVLKNGSWMWQPAEVNCIPNLNELPKTGPGGSFTTNKNPPYNKNTKATLVCAQGYTLPAIAESELVVVGQSLVWQPAEINCIPDLNNLPKTGPGGKFVGIYKPPYQINNEMALQCEPGYLLPRVSVSKVVLRNGNLVWDPPEINCTPPVNKSKGGSNNVMFWLSGVIFLILISIAIIFKFFM